MRVPLFTLCLQFALHILWPRPRRYAGLRDKLHTQEEKERKSEMGWGGCKKKTGGEEKWEGREERDNPRHSNAIIVCIWNW